MSTEDNWLAQAKGLLDQSADGLDAATLSRLNRARQAALASRAAPRRWFLPAGMATAGVMALAAFIWQGYLPSVGAGAQEFPLTAPTAASSDIDLVSSDDSLEFYQDLEFYAWLDAQEQDLGS